MSADEPAAKKSRHTNRSRLSSAIQKLSKEVVEDRGKAPLTGSAIGLLEDICTYVVKRVAIDAARILNGRKTVTLNIISAALRLNIRAIGLFDKLDAMGKEWITIYNAAIAAAKANEKVFLTSGKGAILPGKISPGRISKMIRKNTPGCIRLSSVASIYIAGVINDMIRLYIGKVATSEHAVPAPHRLGVNDFFIETKYDLDLEAIIPYSAIMQFGAEKHYLPRKGHKRAASESGDETPPKKKKKPAVKVEKKKKAAAKGERRRSRR